MAFSLRVSASFRFPLYGMHRVSATRPIGHESFFQASITNPGGDEQITLTNSAPLSHSFLLANLFSFQNTTLMLSYRLDVLPSSPYVLKDVELDSNHLTNNTTVTKDVYSTLALFNAAGAGDLAHLVSTNGSVTGAASLLGLKHVWVRDTMAIDATGQLAGIANNYNQTAVPEIDATSLAGAFPLLVGGLALLERRRRKPTGDAALSGS